MVSVSGVRGIVGIDLTPSVVVRTVSAFLASLRKDRGRMVLGRDTRRSGEFVSRLVGGTAAALGFDAVDLGVAATPTVLLLTRALGCDCGIAVTASHNPARWNAMKLCDGGGLFLREGDIRRVEELAGIGGGGAPSWSPRWHGYDSLGTLETVGDAAERHAETVIRSIDAEAIRRKRFKVAIDPVGGAGAAVGRIFLERLGCEVVGVNERPASTLPGGDFPRGTEPTPENVGALSDLVKRERAGVGFAFDPDGDRLAVVSESGAAIGEEYTLVLAGEAYLRRRLSSVVCNLSTSMMVDDLAERYGVGVERTKIGEINVTSRLLEQSLHFGGEGNGGVIVPEVNPCRDSVVGMGLILELLAETGRTVGEIVSGLPSYCMKKEKCPVPDVERSLLYAKIGEWVRKSFAGFRVDETDGVKAIGAREWVHLRLSNTEPFLRIMAEARDEERAQRLVEAGREFAGTLKA